MWKRKTHLNILKDKSIRDGPFLCYNDGASALVDNQRAEISIFNYLSFSARLKQTNKQNKNEKKETIQFKRVLDSLFTRKTLP